MVQVSGVLLVAPSAALLETRRKELTRAMKDVLLPGQEQRATSQVGVGGWGSWTQIVGVYLSTIYFYSDYRGMNRYYPNKVIFRCRFWFDISKSLNFV